MNKLQRELFNAEIVNRAVESDKVIKAVEELSCCLNNKPTMEDIVKGEIPKGMDIHHKNLNKLDNRIENLQMMTKSEHQKLHRKMEKEVKCPTQADIVGVNSKYELGEI